MPLYTIKEVALDKCIRIKDSCKVCIKQTQNMLGEVGNYNKEGEKKKEKNRLSID